MGDALRTMRARPGTTMSSIRASATTASCGTVTVTAADDGADDGTDTGGDTGMDDGTDTGGDTGMGDEEGGLSSGTLAIGLGALAAAGYFVSQQ